MMIRMIMSNMYSTVSYINIYNSVDVPIVTADLKNKLGYSLSNTDMGYLLAVFQGKSKNTIVQPMSVFFMERDHRKRECVFIWETPQRQCVEVNGEGERESQKRGEEGESKMAKACGGIPELRSRGDARSIWGMYVRRREACVPSERRDMWCDWIPSKIGEICIVIWEMRRGQHARRLR